MAECAKCKCEIGFMFRGDNHLYRYRCDSGVSFCGACWLLHRREKVFGCWCNESKYHEVQLANMRKEEIEEEGIYAD